ncbi:hypothetical protein YC2023_090472 [Brassica napus]
MNATWLILPVVICLSQRLSHACENEYSPNVTKSPIYYLRSIATFFCSHMSKKNGEPTKVVSIQKFFVYVLRAGTAYMDLSMAYKINIWPDSKEFCDTKTNTLRTEKRKAPSNIKSELHFNYYACLGHIHLNSLKFHKPQNT